MSERQEPFSGERSFPGLTPEAAEAQEAFLKELAGRRSTTSEDPGTEGLDGLEDLDSRMYEELKDPEVFQAYFDTLHEDQ